jgi:TrmH family RNA methyltransferase
MMHKVTLRRPLRSQMKLWEKLKQAKYRHKEGLFLAEGHKVVQELLKSTWKPNAILVMEKKMPQWEDSLPAFPEGVDVYGLSERDWDTLSQDKEPEGIMAVVAMPPLVNFDELSAPDTGHILLLHEISNPNNLGAVLRTAHWFGIGTILLSTGSADFTNPKVVRSTMGSLFHLRIIQDINFAPALPKIKERYFLVGTHIQKGIMPHACLQKTALLLGSESHGLPEELIRLTDEQWCIPGTGKADSLSLPQAAAIMMYECMKQE